MKMKTSKRNVAQAAALSSVVTVLAAGGTVLPLANAQDTAPISTETYAVDTADGNGQKFEGGENQGQKYGWSLLGDACLTPGATGNGKSCASDKMVGWNGDPQRDKGWIQLTDAAMTGADGPFGTDTTWKNGQNIGATGNGNQRGSALFNTDIPSSRGLDIQFTQVQGGGSTRRMWVWDGEAGKWKYLLDPTRGADGIGFYLVDGNKTVSLDKPGTYGAGLGYSQGTADSGVGSDGSKIDLGQLKPWDDPTKLERGSDREGANKGVVDAVSGVDNGVIGVGIDAFGNNASRKYGQGYTTSDKYRVPGGEAGYSWEQTALATATDPQGKQACVREPHPGTNPRLNFDVPRALRDLGGYGAEIANRAFAGDCTLIGLVPVKQKSAQFGELPYNDGFDGAPFHEGRFGGNGVSYWEPRTDALTLRGPGNGVDGYQLLATRGYKGASKDQGELSTAFGIRSFRAQTNNAQLANAIDQAARAFDGGKFDASKILTIQNLLSLTGLNTLNEDGFNVHPSSTYYKYFRVTIEPVKQGKDTVEVTVAASNTPGKFPTEGGPNNAFLKSSIPAKYVPELYKFGFSASTGAGTDVHAIRDVKIKALEGGLNLEKSVAIEGGKEVAAAGDKLNYTFKVTNTGEAQLQNVGVSDPILDADAVCDTKTLNPGASTDCKGVHTLTEDDIANKGGKKFTEATAKGLYEAAGVQGGAFDASLAPAEFTSGVVQDSTFVNTAVAYGYNGDSPARNNGLLFSNTDDASVPFGTPPVKPEDPTREGIDLVKEVDSASDLAKDTYAAGDKVPYTFTVTNTGDVKLTDVKVTDKMFTAEENAAITCDTDTLEAGAKATCHGVHTLTAEEASSGEFHNIATAEGTPPGGTPIRDEDDETVPTNPTEGLSLIKDIDTESDLAKSVYAAGDKVPYLFTVENTGNVRIDNVAIEDKALDEDATCKDDSLDPGEKTECRGVHTLTEDEAAAGQFRNVATATGTNPEGNPVRSNEDEEVVPTSQNKLTLVKDVDASSDLAKDTYAAGDKVPYTFTVTNDGPVEIHDVVIVDGALDEDAVCDSTVLAPGASTNCKGVHTLTAEEAAAGKFINVAYASGLDPQNNPVNSNEDQAEVPTAAPRGGALASTGASVVTLGVIGGLLALGGLALYGFRRRNV